MNLVFFNNTTLAWLTALGIAAGVALALYITKRVGVHHMRKLAERTETRLDDIAVEALDGTRLLAIVIMGLFAGSKFLVLPPEVDVFAVRAAIVTGLVQAALWGHRALRAWLTDYYQNRAGDPARATSAAAVGFIAQTVLWTVLLLMVLDNLGVNITTLVASLGIGGIAVALAVQNILGDLFASLSIVLDKPFVIGDFIIVDKYLGTVEYVGLKTTRLRSLGGEQLVFSNADLLKSRLQNMTRMNRRRAVFTVTVTYDTPTATLRRIPAMLTDIVNSQAPVTFDRAHFSGMAASSLNFDVVYWVETADFNVYMNIQQEIYLQIMDRFAAEGIEFAFPTQTLYMHDVRAPEAVAPPAPAAS
ncbi:mechanosensitive ion channel family protein [Massilia rhizosphaerae]|uniref:mechanosensitive ion channel family protein n=1 Tax=Massilia rhizosphaerae TaxID=2784389 RepID=UPI0018DC94A5|nr:mechanosensitive ion channel family protein [Massilia rhizosphaerae]